MIAYGFPALVSLSWLLEGRQANGGVGGMKRCIFGGQVLPYIPRTRAWQWLKNFCLVSYTKDASNVFQWDQERHNLPGGEGYDPALLGIQCLCGCHGNRYIEQWCLGHWAHGSRLLWCQKMAAVYYVFLRFIWSSILQEAGFQHGQCCSQILENSSEEWRVVGMEEGVASGRRLLECQVFLFSMTLYSHKWKAHRGQAACHMLWPFRGVMQCRVITQYIALNQTAIDPSIGLAWPLGDGSKPWGLNGNSARYRWVVLMMMKFMFSVHLNH